MTDNPTPRERLAASHSDSSGYDGPEVRRLKRIARAHKPENDEEMDRLRALGDKLPGATRMAVGYHDRAKSAAAELHKKGH